MQFSAEELKQFKKYYLPFKNWLEQGLAEPSCAQYLIKTEDIIILTDNINVKNDGTIEIDNAELYNAARAARDNEPGACNVVIQFHLRDPRVGGVLGYTTLGGPSGDVTPPPIVSVCHD